MHARRPCPPDKLAERRRLMDHFHAHRDPRAEDAADAFLVRKLDRLVGGEQRRLDVQPPSAA